MQARTWLSVVGLLAGLLGVQYWLGWQQVLQPWLSLKLWQFALIALALGSSYLLRAYRVYHYFQTELHGYWWASVRLSLLHNLFNNLLPARSGELSFPLLMKRYFGLDYAHSSAALVWFRVLDLHAIVIFLVFPWLLGLGMVWLQGLVLLLWAAVPVGLYRLRIPLRHYLTSHPRWGKTAQKALQGLPQDSHQFWLSVWLTWVNWLVKLGVLTLVLGLLVDAPLHLLMAGVIGGELSSILPLHAPGGFGTYEAGIIAPLLLAVDLKSASEAALNLHLLVLGSSLIVGGLAYLLPKPPALPSTLEQVS